MIAARPTHCPPSMMNSASLTPLARTAGILTGRLALAFWLAGGSAVFAANAITSTVLGTAAKETAQAEQATESVSIEELRAQLEAEKKAAALIENSPNHAGGAPAIARDDELKLRRYYVLERIRAIESQIRSLNRQSELNQQLEKAREAANSWTTLDQPPPYPITLVDELVREKNAAESQVQSHETRRNLLRAMRDTMSGSLKDLSVAVRQKEEVLTNADATRKVALAWRLELDRQRVRMTGAIVKSLEAAQKVSEIELTTAELAASLATRKAEAAESESTFTEADYKRIQAALDDESAGVSRELSRAVDAEAAAMQKLERAVETLNQQQSLAATEAPDASSAASTERLRHAVALAEIEVSATNASLDILRFMPSGIEMKRAVWEDRYRLHGKRTPQVVAETRKNLADMEGKLTLLTQIVDRQKNVVRADMADRAQLLLAASDDNKRELLNRAQDFDSRREELLGGVTTSLNSTKYLLSRVAAELGNDGKTHLWGSGVKTAYYRTSGLLLDAWNFELLAIEDSINVDGKKVTGYTSITLGKVLRAIFLFVGGVFLSLWLSRLAESFFVRRFNYDPAQARILRKWISTAGLAIILVAVLVWVRIPLTVFAFLGGAIAIGLGFGMQNLLKNLISGLMLLFERPFRAGDLVEVGPIRGNIVEIGIRSSLIRDGNGVDTLIPNNTFVEQSVTNWTYESAKVRFCIRVGVGYGSPVREVAQLLADCVARHGLVLKEPAPEILFENFGADALEFGVYYWLEIGPTVSNRLVSSDLRFIIEKVLRENDISISYPQRDVHLDVAGPLKVQIAREE